MGTVVICILLAAIAFFLAAGAHHIACLLQEQNAILREAHMKTYALLDSLDDKLRELRSQFRAE